PSGPPPIPERDLHHSTIAGRRFGRPNETKCFFGPGVVRESNHFGAAGDHGGRSSHHPACDGERNTLGGKDGSALRRRRPALDGSVGQESRLAAQGGDRETRAGAARPDDSSALVEEQRPGRARGNVRGARARTLSRVDPAGGSETT